MEAGSLPIWGILGVINLDMHHFLCVITEKAHAAELQGQTIFEVTQVRLISFAGANVQLEPNWQAYVTGIERLLTSGYYFSEVLDIS